MHKTTFAEDTFGDRFSLESLTLPRKARGYAVQRLDTDQLLDATGALAPIRNHGFDSLFASFDAAHAAASTWLEHAGIGAENNPLAIVPAGFDDELQRPILIYGVLRGQP